MAEKTKDTGTTAKRRPRPAGAWTPQRPLRRKPNVSQDSYLAGQETDGSILYGWHAVSEALANPARRFRRLLVTENASRRLAEVFHNVPVEQTVVHPQEIDRLLGPDAVHQGFLLEADSLDSLTVEDLKPDSVILVLDQLTDPHNVGAIVRTAAAFAVDAILTTARHSPAATGVLAKTASGGLEHVPFVIARNLAGALQTLSERGYLCIGLDSEESVPLDGVEVRRPLALVLGAEGKGLRHLTRERCNVLARLDLPGKIRSLNVSNAAAIALHSVMTRLPHR